MLLTRFSSLYKAIFTVWFIFTTNNVVFAADKTSESNQDSKIFKILALGDSLTAGYGLESGDGFVDQLTVYLNNQNLNQKIHIINAGVSGDTTAGGQARLGWSLAEFGPKGPDLVLVALGGNDGLRGINPEITQQNMRKIVTHLTSKKINLYLIGMQAPPNLGPDYGQQFNRIFTDLAKEFSIPLYPFFLDGVAADKDLNQKDGIHPNKQGVAVIVEKMGPSLLAVIKKLQKNKSE